ncbi:hypothetical protein KUCAC02_021860, partial [Chaenocephalus aceratus]
RAALQENNICDEVLRNCQSWEQCEGRRVPQQEVPQSRVTTRSRSSLTPESDFSMGGGRWGQEDK